MKNLKNKKGITLVALVITIVVLLILAVILINSINNNGIIGKAKEARQNYTNSAEKEQEYLTDQLDKIDIALDKVATGEAVTGVTGMIRDIENGLIYKVIDENAKTAEVYGDRGDIDYTGSNWLYNDILTTGNISIKGKVKIEDSTYNVIKVANNAFYFYYYDFDFGTMQETIKEDHASITSVKLEDGIETIGVEAFKKCTDLNSIDLPNSLISIGVEQYEMGAAMTNSRSFAGCTSLSNITIPSGVTTIGDEAFQGCTSLNNINIPNSVTRIEMCTFEGCTSLNNINIPNSVTEIGSYAFKSCTALTDIDIPNTVTLIANTAFDNTPWLTTKRQENGGLVIAGDGVLFDGTTASGNITIPSSVKVIGGSVFYDNENITGLVISEGVTEIGFNAFFGCRNITSITLPSTLKKIGGQAFYWGCKVQNINIPANVEIVGYAAFGCWDQDGVENQTITVNWKNGTKPERWEEGWVGLPSDRIIINNIT